MGGQVTRSIVIGRSPDADLIVDDQYASLRHARISELPDGSLVVEDLGTVNGTFLNGRSIFRPTPFRPGDVLRVGRTQIPWGWKP